MSADELLWVLAIDHRDSFRTQFLGLNGTPTAADVATARALKAIVFEGLRRAIAAGIPEGTPGLLVDEEYGGDLIAAARAEGAVTAVPVEESGQRWLRIRPEPDAVPGMLQRLAPTYAKVLIRFRPDDPARRKRAQIDQLLHLQDVVQGRSARWMVELLTPAPDDPTRSEDDELRAEHVICSVQELTAAGLTPHLWKLEGMPTTAAYEAVAEAAGTRGGARCLVLGRGADDEAVSRWLTLAAPVRGFTGFAIGRTLWWRPLADHRAGRIDRRGAADAIAANYLRMIRTYLRAARRSD